MGSINDMRNANRAAAICREDEGFLDYMRRYIGATVEAVQLSVNDPIGTIAALFTVRLDNGETQRLDGPRLAETFESGVLGFDLQEQYQQEDLRRLLEAAIANPDNGLDERDRDALREELEELPNYYGG
jgi:hypothetical protein